MLVRLRFTFTSIAAVIISYSSLSRFFRLLYRRAILYYITEYLKVRVKKFFIIKRGEFILLLALLENKSLGLKVWDGIGLRV